MLPGCTRLPSPLRLCEAVARVPRNPWQIVLPSDSNNLEALPNSLKLAAAYQDADWQPPLYDVWTMARNNNETKPLRLCEAVVRL